MLTFPASSILHLFLLQPLPLRFSSHYISLATKFSNLYVSPVPPFLQLLHISGQYVSPASFLLRHLSFSGIFPSPASFLLRHLSFSGIFPSPASFLLRHLSFSGFFPFPPSFLFRYLFYCPTKEAGARISRKQIIEDSIREGERKR